MITMDKTYKTRDGRSARLLCVDRNDEEFPVVFTAEDGELACCDLDGMVYGATESNVDLIEVKPSVVFWVNVTANNTIHPYRTLEDATEDFYPASLLIQGRRVELPIEEESE